MTSEEDDGDLHEWQRLNEEKQRKQKRADHLAAIGEPLPRIIQELYLNLATRFDFCGAVYDRDGTIHFPFGGTCVQRHSRDTDLWRVHISLPIHSGWLPLRSPIYGYLMSRDQAIQFAREMQP
jgi:hypothetical protein